MEINEPQRLFSRWVVSTNIPHPKNPWTLQWRGEWTCIFRRGGVGIGPQNWRQAFEGFDRILRANGGFSWWYLHPMGSNPRWRNPPHPIVDQQHWRSNFELHLTTDPTGKISPKNRSKLTSWWLNFSQPIPNAPWDGITYMNGSKGPYSRGNVGKYSLHLAFGQQKNFGKPPPNRRSQQGHPQTSKGPKVPTFSNLFSHEFWFWLVGWQNECRNSP